MPDRFSNNAASLSGPASHAFTITPSDTADLAEAVRALYVGSGGAVSVRTVSGASVTFLTVAGGAILPVRADRVFQTGTTAADIVGLI
ncbi:hypothetical protein QO002_000567 [Pararhizobium capsulatum DSM 1112]|uniref:Uncharacterized protein n=1 Tax=Pararhizobium capsulatum DSM 1112 TaxID=1121113 RepID=A0ABU0BL13_9HYPH|nr:hypothetical protein [Pararhizobium capsulatum]MDQ0318429.1 hypothetical protein [Pararhizobium capsulatum DSM 1112]